MNANLLTPNKDPMGYAIADNFSKGKAGRLRVFSSQFDEDEIPKSLMHHGKSNSHTEAKQCLPRGIIDLSFRNNLKFATKIENARHGNHEQNHHQVSIQDNATQGSTQHNKEYNCRKVQTQAVTTKVLLRAFFFFFLLSKLDFVAETVFIF